jgi:hypothetical protein
LVTQPSGQLEPACSTAHDHDAMWRRRARLGAPLLGDMLENSRAPVTGSPISTIVIAKANQAVAAAERVSVDRTLLRC